MVVVDEREREKETDRRRDRQTERQTDGKTGRVFIDGGTLLNIQFLGGIKTEMMPMYC